MSCSWRARWGSGSPSNHPFEQGNKRTGFACAIDFLDMNGFALPEEQDDALGRTFEAVIAHALSEEAFIAHVRRLMEEGLAAAEEERDR